MKPTTSIEQLSNYCNLYPNAKTKDVIEILDCTDKQL